MAACKQTTGGQRVAEVARSAERGLHFHLPQACRPTSCVSNCPTIHKPLGSYFSTFSFQLSVFNSQFTVFSFQFSVLSSQFSVFSSQFSVLSSQFSVFSSLLSCSYFSTLSFQFSVFNSHSQFSTYNDPIAHKGIFTILSCFMALAIEVLTASSGKNLST